MIFMFYFDGAFIDFFVNYLNIILFCYLPQGLGSSGQNKQVIKTLDLFHTNPKEHELF